MSDPFRPVVSGLPYVVRQVRGHAPEGLGDFAGETTFVVDLDDEGYDVSGPGVPNEGGVRVFEKADGGAGKDVRTWHVVQAGGSFTATPGAAPGRG